MKSLGTVSLCVAVICAAGALWSYSESQRLLNENERLKFSDTFNEKRVALMQDQLKDMEFQFASKGTYNDGYRDAVVRTQGGSYSDGFEAAKLVYGNASYDQGYHNAINQFDYYKKEEIKAKSDDKKTDDKVSSAE